MQVPDSYAKVLRPLALAGLFAVVSAASSAAAAAADFPTKAVTLVVAYPAGGPADMIARQLAQGLTKRWGQPVVIENKGGATGLVGAAAVARAPADGHTLGVLVTPATAIAPLVQKDFPFDLSKDLTAISALADYSLVLMAGPQTGAKTLKELVDYGKKNPNKLSYGSSGVGGTNHLAGELLARATETPMLHVPYKGNAPAVSDAMAGMVSFTFAQTDAALGLAAGGKLKALAITSAQRSPLLPAVPTLVELGYPDMVVGGWTGVFSPAGLPEGVQHEIAQAIDAVKQSPEFKDKLTAAGFVIPASTPQSFSKRVQDERDYWKHKIAEANIPLQ